MNGTELNKNFECVPDCVNLQYLLAGVPVETRACEDKPEALPLLGDEDTAILSLLPQPAVAVGATEFTAGHTTPTHSCRHSWEDERTARRRVQEKKSNWFLKEIIKHWNRAVVLSSGMSLVKHDTLPFVEPFFESLFP